MKKLISIFCALAAIVAISACEKANDDTSWYDPAKEAAKLVGAWNGLCTPILGSSYDLTMEFTTSTVTLMYDGQTKTYNFKIIDGYVEGEKYLAFEIDNDLQSAFFYAFKNEKLEIVSGNSSYSLNGTYSRFTIPQ